MPKSDTRPEGVDWGLKADRIAIGIALVTGLLTVLSAFNMGSNIQFMTAVMLGVVLILARRAPGAALALFWAAALLNLTGQDVFPSPIEIAAGGWLAYMAPRLGRRWVVVFSGLSLAAGTILGAAVLSPQAYGAGAFPFIMVLIGGYLGTPWLLGLRQRSKAQVEAQWERAEDAEWRRLRAIEAQQRSMLEEQRLSRVAAEEAASARLARDVHDVVGHSLAVILMQAESAQYLSHTQDLHESMSNIAGCARRSLGEIREVLHAARGEKPSPASAPSGGLQSLLDSVRATGIDLEVTTLGQSRALPPDSETIAYRVLQEMLTNAIKHGEHGRPIAVALAWADRLTMEVRNLDGGHTISRTLHGVGISGMTSRLQAVGGSFELNRQRSDDGEVVTATAWLPLRAN